MKKAQEARDDPGTKNKTKGTKQKESTNTASLNKKETTQEDKKDTSNETSSKGTSNGGDFEGDYFKDFYYNQGDYHTAEMEEEEEMKHAKEISDSAAS